MPNQYKAIIFDLDNTLLDFMKMKDAAVRAAVSAMIEAGLDVESEPAVAAIIKIYDERGYEFQEVFNLFLQDEAGAINYKYLASAIVAYRRAREASLMLYPKVSATIIALVKRGLLLGVLSDAPSREAWMRLCYLNLHHTFDAVVTFDDTGHFKPAPEPFLKICRLLDIEPGEALMVGDWPERDLEGARLAGMSTAYAQYGNTRGDDYPEADYYLSDFSDLLAIVNKVN